MLVKPFGTNLLIENRAMAYVYKNRKQFRNIIYYFKSYRDWAVWIFLSGPFYFSCT